MRATGILVLLLLTPMGLADDKKAELTPEQRQELKKKAAELDKEGVQQYQRRNLVKAKAAFRELVAVYRTLYPRDQFPNGHADLANSLTWLALVHHTAGEFDKAETFFKEALAVRRALYPREKFPRGHKDLATSITGLALMYWNAADYSKAEPLFREALDMFRTLYPKEEFPQGHSDLAAGLEALAWLLHSTGEYGQAEPLFQEALTMRRALYPTDKYPNGHPFLALTINKLAALYKDMGAYDKAEALHKEALAMRRALYPRDKFPQGHPELAYSLNDLGLLYQATGEYARSAPLLKEALDMRRALFPRDQFPRGHPDLALSISNLGTLYWYMGERAGAEPLLQETLAVCRTLYPKEQFPRGHPYLAYSLSNLAVMRSEAGEYSKAEPLADEALALRRALYPKDEFPRGHRQLAESLTVRASLHLLLGEYDQADPLFHEALAMWRALYPREQFPNGHPDLILGATNLATLHLALGEPGPAKSLCNEALTMERKLVRHYADLAAEAECLNYLQTFPWSRDGLLSTTRNRPGAANCYDVLWDSRSALTRLQEGRHRDLIASRDKETADLADQLRRTRNRLAALLLRPGRDLEAHRANVHKLTDAKEDLEKRINARLKLAPLPSAAASSPKRLAEALPADAAFVDLFRYFDITWDPKMRGKKGEKRTPRYVAFIVRKGKDVARVELKEAAPIDEARGVWQRAITATHPDDTAERQAAAALDRLVWAPLREALPADLKTVYLAPDSQLSQVPWGALPGKKPETVLLDECAVCLVPHGPFLLEHLQDRSRERGGDTLMAYGGINYDQAPDALSRHDDVRGPLLSEKKRLHWGELPGTVREQEQIVALAGKALKDPPIIRSGRSASTKHLEEDLPQARYAHMATHGFFADAAFRSAIQIDPKLFEYRGVLDRRGGARSPLVLSGLVLAGANRTDRDAAEDRGIITAEGLIGLRLEGLELAVLSACETGLGASGGGEGVYGLQRAFHVAGCQNVIASLWKVDDGATQALMTLFYRNLWEKRLDAAEALRQAQLTLYRHPEAVQVAQKRGLDFTESDLPRIEGKPVEEVKHSLTAHWAAFTFSGVRPVK
jgi:CHAT domain-containing protein